FGIQNIAFWSLSNHEGLDARVTSKANRKGRQGRQRNQSPVRNASCCLVSGTTERRPWRTRGESANSLFALMAASVTESLSGAPTLILTAGFFGSDVSTETTVAVPTALFSSPV